MLVCVLFLESPEEGESRLRLKARTKICEFISSDGVSPPPPRDVGTWREDRQWTYGLPRAHSYHVVKSQSRAQKQSLSSALLKSCDRVLPVLERRKGFAKQIDGLTSPLRSAGF